MFRKLFFSFFLLSLFFIPHMVFAGYNSGICAADPCKSTEVGVFMKDISQTCGNLGNCELVDIMMVFMNIGNFVLSIVGGLVLLMYVIGGFYYLASGGDDSKVKKGKAYITTSTVGLLIVFFAFMGIRTLQSVITDEPITDASAKYELCTGKNEGPCGNNSLCTKPGGMCLSKCEKINGAVCTTNEPPGGQYDCTKLPGKTNCPLAKQICCVPKTYSAPK